MNINWKAVGTFVGGIATATAGVKIFASKDAKKAYTQVLAAGFRAKDCIMKTVDSVQENVGDIVAEAKEINVEREESSAAEEEEC